VSEVSRSTPRLLINREVVGPFASPWKGRRNDVVLKGDVITGIKRLVKLLEWSDVMNDIVDEENKKWKSENEQDLELSIRSDADASSITQPTINLSTKPSNGTRENDSRNYHTLTGNLNTKPKNEVEKNEVEKNEVEKNEVEKNEASWNYNTFTGNSVLNSTTKESLCRRRNLEKEDKIDVNNASNSTRTLRLLAGNGTKFSLPGKCKVFNQSSTGFDNGKDSSQLKLPGKDSLFSCNSVARRMPLLPFRYTHRTIPESLSGNFKNIDPSRDLASAGFGMGRPKSNGSEQCYLSSSSDSDTSSSDDDLCDG
jgi:hypothetical protein